MAALFLAAVPFTGCAGKDFNSLHAGIERRGHYIEGVPFTRQREYDCGPAALTSVLAYWGKNVGIDRVRERIYTPKLRGTLPMDIESFLRDEGFDTASSSGTLDQLKAWVRSNVPVICLLDLGFGPYRQPHYVTVIGFDDVNAVIIAYDGLKANRVIGYDAFGKQWDRAGDWMLAARPKSP